MLVGSAGMCIHHTLADDLFAHPYFGAAVLLAAWLGFCLTAVAVSWIFAQLVRRHTEGRNGC